MSREGLALRVARAVNHLRATLQAGFTTVRDLGTEGAGYADVELKQAVNQGIMPGPRILASTRAIVATGSYQPKFVPEWTVPQGAEEADGIDSLTRVVRDQIGKGADWIKLYADYRWGPLPGSRPTFSLDELKLAVETAKSAGVPIAVHANTAEGMRRAALAGVETIEHGGEGTPEVFKLMAEHHVALCPTITAGAGPWPPADPDSPGAARKRASFKAALDAGVTILNGSDVGTFPHGDNARELEAMVAYGMPPVDALKSATSTAARVLHMEKQIGAVKPGPVRRSRRVRRRPDERHRRAETREVRDEERDGLPAAVAATTFNAETAEPAIRRSGTLATAQPRVQRRQSDLRFCVFCV